MARTADERTTGANGAGEARKPKVVVLMPWGVFGEHGEHEILERAGCEVVVANATTEEEMIAAARDADGLYFTGGLSRRFIESLTRCKVIAMSSIRHG